MSSPVSLFVRSERGDPWKRSLCCGERREAEEQPEHVGDLPGYSSFLTILISFLMRRLLVVRALLCIAQLRHVRAPSMQRTRPGFMLAAISVQSRDPRQLPLPAKHPFHASLQAFRSPWPKCAAGITTLQDAGGI